VRAAREDVAVIAQLEQVVIVADEKFKELLAGLWLPQAAAFLNRV